MPRILLILILLILSISLCAQEIVSDTDKPNSVLPTYQKLHPAGRSVEFGGRPVDLAMAPDKKHLYVKDNRGVVVIDVAQWKVIQEINVDGGTSFHGIVVSSGGHTLYVTNSKSQIAVGSISDKGLITWKKPINLPGKGESFPCGLALRSHDTEAVVCLSRSNSIAVVDLKSGRVTREISVGIAPWGAALSRDEQTAYVTNWGGRRPIPTDKTADSGGSPVRIDSRGIGNSGTLSIVDLKAGKALAEIDTGLHPCDLKLSSDGTRGYTSDANSDTVSVIDTTNRKLIKTLSTRPGQKLQFGSAPTGITLAADEKTAYVTNGGNNTVAVLPLNKQNGLSGLIPAGWYPGAIIRSGNKLYVANVKGVGSRRPNKSHRGWSVYDFQGTVQEIKIPDQKELTAYTSQSTTNDLIAQMRLALEKRKSGSKRVPVPTKTGESSIFEHVIYVIKENRTYDQLFGDLKQANGDSALCTFGRKVTPNHHALAEQFVLLDNFYCNGVNSADGHSWVTEGSVTDHLEKAQGGYTRSYTWGDDALNYCSSGFIWDNVLAHGLSFTNFGEMDYASSIPPAKFSAYYHDYFGGPKKIQYKHNVGIANLKKYTVEEYPGWNTSIPDQIRADIFLKHLQQFEADNSLPNFTILYLPNDHIGEDISPESYLADNDLALGKVVEGITKSRFWPNTCIFVVEDDPQNGWDHVDGHRSLCLVISPYTKRKTVIHSFYNQTSVIHTMEAILGLPPMNQMDAIAPLMNGCFQQRPDLSAFSHLPNSTPLLDEKHALYHILHKSPHTASIRFDKPDIINDSLFNKLIWNTVRRKTAYPFMYAGAHGRGLKRFGLMLSLRKTIPDVDGD